jgi:hypothetical protein
MVRSLFIFILSLAVATSLQAQVDSSHLRITLLTCGTGEEVWETFGHSAVRVTDSTMGTDMVYNYGTFDGYDENFLPKFVRGKLLYYVTYYPYNIFLQEYQHYGRSVFEQDLILNGDQKQQIYDFLKWNAQEENRYYKYDFFFDNCATRIRDAFPQSLGKGFKFAQVLPKGEHKLTFRDIINQYFYKVHWQRFGVNLLLGSPIDSVMTNSDIMFLPDYLRDGITGATLNGQPVSTRPQMVVPGSERKPAGLNEPLVVMAIVALLTIVGLVVRPLRKLGNVMMFLVLFVTGLLGWLMIFMWLGTDHQACQNNFNILWALPTNLFLAMASKRNKDKYAIVGIVLMFAALVLHLLKIQVMPLLELWPLLLSLLLIYGTIYRRGKIR